MLRGRRSECRELDRLLETMHSGQSAVLVLRGEAGIGKTALLEYTAEHAEGCRVLHAGGVQSEMELPFAALHQLCAPLLGGLGRLPSPQREALATAFGLSSGTRPDRFLVGLAVLSLLSGGEEPLVCLIDDAQWFDQSSAQVLAFVARRLQAESVALVFAERGQGELDELAGLPELRLEGLSEAHADALLASVISGPLDERVRQRIVAETHGNPLALLELPHGLSPADLAGGFALTAALPLPSRIEESFRQRVERLPADSQRLLLVAAAEPIGDPTLLWRAADQFGIGAVTAGPAEDADLITLGARVIFRHPLLRSAIYRAASADERRSVHRALAEPPIPRSIRIAAPGTWPTRRSLRTRTSPWSSSAQRTGREHAAGSLRRRRSWSGRRGSPRTLRAVPGGAHRRASQARRRCARSGSGAAGRGRRGAAQRAAARSAGAAACAARFRPETWKRRSPAAAQGGATPRTAGRRARA